MSKGESSISILSGDTTTVDLWYPPTQTRAIEREGCIEIIYKEVSRVTYTIHPSPDPEERVFKITFSCKDGKWHKSERIYGHIRSATGESYEF